MAFMLPIQNFWSLILDFKGFRHCSNSLRHCSNSVFSLIIRSDVHVYADWCCFCTFYCKRHIM